MLLLGYLNHHYKQRFAFLLFYPIPSALDEGVMVHMVRQVLDLTDDVLDNWLLNELHFLDSSSDSESVSGDSFDDFEDQELNASESSDGDSDIQDSALHLGTCKKDRTNLAIQDIKSRLSDRMLFVVSLV